ncbi:MAG: phosphotransferase [Candidatus Wallbacteria bacterium]|nr:phosphotransferase [Candidatus Wallbacteria bacterium]
MLSRYRALARDALDRYGLRQPQFSLVKFGENITWRVRTADSNQFLLRVHRPVYHSAAETGSELAWLRELRRSTGMAVPEPVETATGEPIALAGAEDPHVCTLLRWMPGRHHWRAPLPGHLRALGRTMAQLHAHTLSWRRPRELPRPTWDWNGLLSPHNVWSRSEFDLPGLFAEEDRPAVREALGRIRATMRELDTLKDSHALIHADLHFGNVVFASGQACPIDFDDCGYGYLTYDLATTLIPFRETPDWERVRSAVLEGYTEVREFPAKQLERLPEFLAARRLTMAIWLSSRGPLIPRLPRDLGPYLARTAELCRRLAD